MATGARCPAAEGLRTVLDPGGGDEALGAAARRGVDHLVRWQVPALHRLALRLGLAFGLLVGLL